MRGKKIETHGPTSYVLFLISKHILLRAEPGREEFSGSYKKTRRRALRNSLCPPLLPFISGFLVPDFGVAPNNPQMGVIYKILKQQRRGMDLSLSSATRCKVQAAIKQRQQQRQDKDCHIKDTKDSKDQDQERQKEDLAEQQLQQLCRFLAENASRKKVGILEIFS